MIRLSHTLPDSLAVSCCQMLTSIKIDCTLQSKTKTTPGFWYEIPQNIPLKLGKESGVHHDCFMPRSSHTSAGTLTSGKKRLQKMAYSAAMGGETFLAPKSASKGQMVKTWLMCPTPSVRQNVNRQGGSERPVA